MKIVTEMAAALLDKDYGSQLMTLMSLQQHKQVSESAVIAQVAQALVGHLQSATFESIELPPLLRSCEALGRFLVHR